MHRTPACPPVFPPAALLPLQASLHPAFARLALALLAPAAPAEAPHAEAPTSAATADDAAARPRNLHTSTGYAAAVLQACIALVATYTTPASKVFARHLNEELHAQLAFLDALRPFPPAVASAGKFVRGAVSCVPPSKTDAEAQALVLEAARGYLHDRVLASGLSAAVEEALAFLRPGDTVTVFAPAVAGTVVERALLAVNARLTAAAAAAGTDADPFSAAATPAGAAAAAAASGLRVAVIDARPAFAGQGLLQRLAAGGITSLAYTQLHGARKALAGSSALVVSAEAVGLEGAVAAAAGTGIVAALAAAAGVRTLAVADSTRLLERALPDAACVNALLPVAGVVSPCTNASTVDASAAVPAPLAHLTLSITRAGGLAATSSSSAGAASSAAAAPAAAKPAASGGKGGAAAPLPVQPWASLGHGLPGAPLAAAAGGAPASGTAASDAVVGAASLLPVDTGLLATWRARKGLKLLALAYDVLPPSTLATVAGSGIVTEVGLVPPSAVGVVVHEFARLSGAQPADDEEEGAGGEEDGEGEGGAGAGGDDDGGDEPIVDDAGGDDAAADE